MRVRLAWLSIAAVGCALAGYTAGRRASVLPVEASGASASAGLLATPDRGALETELSRLRSALAAEREGRESREREWLEFTRAMASLGVSGTPSAPGFLGEGDEEPAAEEVVDGVAEEPPAPDPALVRAGEIRRDLRALLLGEQVLGLDVLEVGRVADGATGPVVVRLLDDRGRPSGLLASERLRLECSRAARSVTLVFEDGYERFGNQVVPFGAPTGIAAPDADPELAALDARGDLAGDPGPGEDEGPGEDPGEDDGPENGGDAGPGGVAASSAPAAARGARRIDLPHVDPRPWIALLPELFRAQDLMPTPDDGQWERVLVLQELNRLLRATERGGRWQLAELGGVVADTLWEVRLEQLDGRQRVIQRIFADRLRIQGEGGGILLVLEDGVAERNGKRAPFFDGRYRIFLPAAPVAEWRSSDLPHALGTKKAEDGAEQG